MQIRLQLAETNYRLFQLTLHMRKVIRPLPSKLCKCSWCKRTLTTSAKGEHKKNLADSASQRKVWPCLRNAVVQGVCPEILRRDRKGRQVCTHTPHPVYTHTSHTSQCTHTPHTVDTHTPHTVDKHTSHSGHTHLTQWTHTPQTVDTHTSHSAHTHLTQCIHTPHTVYTHLTQWIHTPHTVDTHTSHSVHTPHTVDTHTSHSGHTHLTQWTHTPHTVHTHLTQCTHTSHSGHTPHFMSICHFPGLWIQTFHKFYRGWWESKPYRGDFGGLLMEKRSDLSMGQWQSQSYRGDSGWPLYGEKEWPFNGTMTEPVLQGWFWLTFVWRKGVTFQWDNDRASLTGVILVDLCMEKRSDLSMGQWQSQSYRGDSGWPLYGEKKYPFSAVTNQGKVCRKGARK